MNNSLFIIYNYYSYNNSIVIVDMIVFDIYKDISIASRGFISSYSDNNNIRFSMK